MIFDIEKYSTLPKGWSKVKLSDLADFNAKSWSKKDKPNTIHYIDISSVSTGRVENPTGMLFDEAPSRARRKVSSGDIIISTVRPNLKQFALLDFELENLTASTGFCTISPKKAEYTWLIYSIITTDIFTEHLVRVAQGAAYPAIKPSDIADAYVGLPPEHELKEFNLLVSALWQKQSVNETMNQTLEKIAQRIFKSWFIDFDPVKANKEGVAFDGLSPEIQALFPSEFEESELGMIPKGWEVTPLSSLVKLTGGGTPKRSEDTFWNGDILWFSMKDIPGNSEIFVVETEEKITELGLQKSSTKLLPRGTTIITARGTVGKLALVAKDMCMNQSCYGVKGLEVGDYFNYFNLKQAISTLKQHVHGAVFDTITGKTFDTYSLAFSGSELANVYDKLVTPLLEKSEINSLQNKSLRDLRDRLLPKLISGQITVGEAQKELAEAI